MKRVLLFIVTNLAVMLVLGIAARDAGLSGVRLTFGDCEGPAMNAALATWAR